MCVNILTKSMESLNLSSDSFNLHTNLVHETTINRIREN